MTASFTTETQDAILVTDTTDLVAATQQAEDFLFGSGDLNRPLGLSDTDAPKAVENGFVFTLKEY